MSDNKHDDKIPPEQKPQEQPEHEKHSHLHLPEMHIPELHIPDLHEAGELVRSGQRRLNIWFHSAMGAGTLLLIGIIGILWYTNTAQFAALVRQRVQASMAAATGGRVELQSFRWDMWRRNIIVDGVTVHGLEKAGEAPYMHVDHVEAQLRWSGFFFSSYVYLESLRVVHPSFHLIVAKDGTTNQPHPAHEMNSIQQTLLDMAVSQISVEQGVAVINTHALPFDFAARNATLKLKYVAATPGTTDDAHAERYTADFSSDDVHTRTFSEAQVASRMQGQFLFTRDAFHLQNFRWNTAATELDAVMDLTNFSHPQWHGVVTGTVDIHEVAALTGIDGFSGGIAHINLNAHSCDNVKQTTTHKSLLQLKQERSPIAQHTCTENFIVEGSLSGSHAAWDNQFVQVETLDASTQVYVTPNEMDFLNMHATLADGANGRGDLHMYNFMTDAPKTPLHGVLDAHVVDVPLHDVLVSLAPKQYAALEYNTASTGDVHVEWGMTVPQASVHGSLQQRAIPGAAGVPINGVVQASYTGASNTIKIASLALTTPQSNIDVSGVLGVMNGDPLTTLHTDITTHNLGEFDSLLHTLKVSGKVFGKDETIILRGSAEFHGNLAGPLQQLDLRGHLSASNVDAPAGRFVTAYNWLQPDIHLDALNADLEISPAGLSVRDAHLQLGAGSMDLHGQLHPSTVLRANPSPRGRSYSTTVWDKNSLVDVSLDSHSFPIAALFNIPMTGALDADAHLTGTLSQPIATGKLNARNGTMGGSSVSEPYRLLTTTLTSQGSLWSLQKATLTMPAGTVTGDASFDSISSRITWHLHTVGYALNKLQSIAPRTGLTGMLDADASAAGTAENPGIRGTLSIHSLALVHQDAGRLDADLHSSGHQLIYNLHSDAFGGHFEGQGQSSLDVGHMTQMHASFSGLDLAPLLQLSRFRMSGHSELGGEISLNGPLGEPAKLTGNAIINRFHMELSGIALEAAEPLHLSMASNVLHLDQVHITGPDTNVHISGATEFARVNSLRVHTDGSVNLKILQTFDPDLLSSGQITFSVDANGALAAPDYSGSVHINNAALALTDLPNGLNQINGALAFNRDRLEVRQLTTMTGGGMISLGGSITLRDGIYADITARGHDNRIRYPQGVSSSADTDLRLQGTPSNALLSGNVLLTRFGINQEFDFSALATNASGVTAPPDPNAPSSHLRLDVHITSAPQLDFQNSYAKLVGDVDLNLRGTVSTPSVLGRINISEGSASFAGTHYQLQSGAITFTNPVRIEPLINLDATARVRDYDIYISLHGTLANLRPNYRSEPPLHQSDILALLALGRTQQEAQIYQQQQEQGGADTNDNTLLGGALNQTVSNRAQRLFGVGSVKIDPTFIGTLGNSSARITVEQSVTRDVTVTYATNVNQTAEQLIQVTWDLTHNVSLVSQRDENGVFSMTFKIRQRHR